MELREKVIMGLECCMSGQPEGLGCDRVPCPYCDFEDCEGMLHRDALALLKAQEAVSVQKKQIEMVGLKTWDWACGNCGQTVLFSAKYCPWCGQAVKWE